ncbi:MAG TPA: carboxypeptidase regulatory-like domain-containing protein [Terriglobales bacterium]|nr:carboxypeptidase regulatory-like domain-containing protein [Terriglobales bacterium]
MMLQSFSRKKSQLVGTVLLLAALVFTMSSGLYGQATATITGRVTDPNGAVVPKAAVVVESSELAVTRTAETNAEGRFNVPNLQVGIYSLKVNAPGFAPYEQTNIKLDVGSIFNREVSLTVGSKSESVTVSGEIYQTLNTETANVETLISGTQVRDLALNGRNWAQLINLAPGTAALTQDSQQGTNVRIDDTAINGTRRRFAPTIDGVSNVDHGSVGTQVNNISIDAIAEFKLVSTPYSAEFGGQAGPAINVVTKRGTTKFHGTLFEFFRHDALNAYSWESKRVSGTPEKAHLRFNNFGGFVGGPVYKNKLFFFAGVEWKIPKTGRSLNEQVPTLAMRQGNFSAFLPTNSGPITSCTQTLSAADKGKFILCDKSASTTGTPFPNNIIPANKISPNGLAILNLFPQPNSGTATYIASPVTDRTVRQDLARLDWTVSDKISLFGRWTRDNFDSDNPLGSSFDNQNLPIAPDKHQRIGNTAMGSYTHILSNTLLNELTFAWQRNDQTIEYQDLNQIDRTARGINFTEIFPENRLNKIPEVSIQGYSTISGNGLPYDIQAQSWEIRDNLTKSIGAHTMKFGMLYLRSFKQENTRVRDGGTITFSSGSDSSFRPQDSGNAVANLLLGAYQRYQEYSNTTNVPSHYNQWEFYINDQWRVNPRLSLTLGLRYQYIPWPVAEDARIIGFDPSRFDANKAPLGTNISSGTINLIADPTGTHTRAEGYYDPYNGIVLPGCDNNFGDPNLTRLLDCRPSGLATSGNRGIAPRFGFAIDPFGNGKTSIRGGAGIYYDRTLLNPIRDAGANPPFTYQPNITNGRQYTTPSSVVPTFNNPLDTVGAGGTGKPLIQTLNVFAGEMKPGAIYAYSFGIQRELPWSSMFEISYVGNQGRFLTHRRDINYVLAEKALQLKADGTYLNPNTDTVRQYLGYQAIQQQENNGVSNYNGLQTNYVKRTTRGLSLSVAYTWSKTLNNFDTETSNLRAPFDPSYDRSYADFDRRHVIAMSYVYELPFMKNQRGVSGKFLGGWQLSGTTTIQSGRHFSLSGGTRASTAPSIGFGGNTDQIANWRDLPALSSENLWINPAAFTGRRGFIAAIPRNVIEMPMSQFWNMSLMKWTNVTERVKFQFRAEAFNIFNRPNFRTVQTNFSSSNFGQLTETEDPRVLQFALKLSF